MSRFANLLGFVVLCAGSLGAQTSLTVRVHDFTAVPAEVLANAAAEITYIFSASSIHIEWLNCSSKARPDHCDENAGPNEIILRVLPQSGASAAFGADVLGRAIGDQYCDIYGSEVIRTAGEKNVQRYQIFAIVIAHELGHLLLGRGAHTPFGIMRPKWDAADFDAAAQRRLRFTPEQANLLRAGVQSRNR